MYNCVPFFPHYGVLWLLLLLLLLLSSSLSSLCREEAMLVASSIFLHIIEDSLVNV